MQHIVLYFGSFNPIHKGHTAIARCVASSGVCDKVMMVVSPQNPFKDNSMLIDEQHRLRMVELAIAEDGLEDRVVASGIEFELTRPSYTANTLRELALRNPYCRFSLLIGGDNVAGLSSWREAEWIMENYDILVYPRSDGMDVGVDGSRMKLLENVPLLDVSSTMIRRGLSGSKDLGDDIHCSVLEYIKTNKLWM